MSKNNKYYPPRILILIYGGSFLYVILTFLIVYHLLTSDFKSLVFSFTIWIVITLGVLISAVIQATKDGRHKEADH